MVILKFSGLNILSLSLVIFVLFLALLTSDDRAERGTWTYLHVLRNHPCIDSILSWSEFPSEILSAPHLELETKPHKLWLSFTIQPFYLPSQLPQNPSNAPAFNLNMNLSSLLLPFLLLPACRPTEDSDSEGALNGKDIGEEAGSTRLYRPLQHHISAQSVRQHIP